MAVLVIADVVGQTPEGYDGMLAALEADLKEAPGFIAHGAGPSVDGWKTFEVWATLGEATRFFAGFVHPLLPEGVKPKRTIVELDALVIGPLATLLQARDVDTYVPGLSQLISYR
ncbi:MAG: hypothetical protein ABIT71_15705 [Vicinamibacteraceae bacterium]